MMMLWGGFGGVALFVMGIGKKVPLQGATVSLGFFVILGLSGAVGGLAYHVTEPIRSRGWAFHVAANVASMLAYCVAAVLLLGLGVALAQKLGLRW